MDIGVRVYLSDANVTGTVVDISAMDRVCGELYRVRLDAPALVDDVLVDFVDCVFGELEELT